MKKIPIFLLTPNNFSHKAGDGVRTRKREIRIIHPALQATLGSTQCTYLLENWKFVSEDIINMDKIVFKKTLDEKLQTLDNKIII